MEKTKEIPRYLETWFEEPTEHEKSLMDEEAWIFRNDFLSLYREYVGTKSLLKHIRNYINTHEIKRKDDFRFTFICMWIDHIHYYDDLNNIPFKAEKIWKIKIPKEILNVQ